MFKISSKNTKRLWRNSAHKIFTKFQARGKVVMQFFGGKNIFLKKYTLAKRVLGAKRHFHTKMQKWKKNHKVVVDIVLKKYACMKLREPRYNRSPENLANKIFRTKGLLFIFTQKLRYEKTWKAVLDIVVRYVCIPKNLAKCILGQKRYFSP